VNPAGRRGTSPRAGSDEEPISSGAKSFPTDNRRATNNGRANYDGRVKDNEKPSVARTRMAHTKPVLQSRFVI
jgi:hypothetical protein